MISVKVEPRPPAPARPVSPRAAGEQKQPASFDDALRDQRKIPSAPEKDEPSSGDEIPDGNTVRAPDLSMNLALIAPWLPQQPTGPARDDRRARSTEAESPAVAAAGDGSPDLSLGTGALAPATAPVSVAAPEAPVQKFRRVSDELDEATPGSDAKPAESAKDVVANHGATRAHHVDHDGQPVSELRSVAIHHVASANHFPVADPVRQIATEVKRAVEETSSPSVSEPGTNPVKTLSVQLEPESLGVVTLRMRLSGDHLSVRVDVAEPATLDLIQRERDRLQKSMATDKVSIDRLEIRAASEPTPVASGDSANAPKQDMNAQGQQQSRQQGASQGGESRRDRSSDSRSSRMQKNGPDHDAPRSDPSRGVYL